MKAIAVIGFLAALGAVSCSLFSDEDSSVGSSRYLEYLRQRSQIERLRRNFAAICPGKDDELDNAILKVKECSDEINENSETACSIVKNYFMRCSKPFITLFESCLPAESQEVPKLIFSAIDSGAKYICKTDGEHIFELANTCIFKFDARFSSCERRVKAKLQQYKNKTPTKTEICDLAQSMKPCLLNHLKSSCGNTITRDSFMGIFDAMVSSCQSSATEVEFNGENEVELFK